MLEQYVHCKIKELQKIDTEIDLSCLQQEEDLKKKLKQIACNLVYVWGYKVDKFYVPKAKE